MSQELTPEKLEELKHSHIRSFSTRKGRISHAQERALTELFPKYELKYDKENKVNAKELFGNDNPVVLEIGCGMGETTAAIAEAHPEVNFIGCEIFPSGVGALSLLLEEKQLKNVRLFKHDAVEVVRDMIADGSLDGVHIYFPDPWRKARHHKRRLISPFLVDLLSPKLKTGAYLHCATDWENYAEQMMEVLSAAPLLKNKYEGFSPVAENPITKRPVTKFNERGNRLGHGCWDLIFLKK